MLANVQHKSTLADFSGPQLIAPRLRGRDWTAVILELGTNLRSQGLIEDMEAFLQAVVTRERLVPTSTPFGWALPHARLVGVPQLSFALGRSLVPLLWGDKPGVPVHLVFLFAVPEMESKTYLEVIAALARASRSAAFERQLLETPDGPGLFRVLQEVPLLSPSALIVGKPLPADSP